MRQQRQVALIIPLIGGARKHVEAGAIGALESLGIEAGFGVLVLEGDRDLAPRRLGEELSEPSGRLLDSGGILRYRRLLLSRDRQVVDEADPIFGGHWRDLV